jgi:hypothetical protein
MFGTEDSCACLFVCSFSFDSQPLDDRPPFLRIGLLQRRRGGMLGHDALSTREPGATLHGFRSTLSTWAEEQDDGRAYPRSVIRAVLSHGKGDAVTAAYLRSE